MKRTPRPGQRRQSLKPRPHRLSPCRLRPEPLEPRLVLTPVIDVGDHLLRPGTLGQEIDVYVQSANEGVIGVNFNAQVADGGVELGGAYDGPEIQDLVIFNESDPPEYLFDGKNTGTFDLDGPWPESPPFLANQWEGRATTTPEGVTVVANGLLATMTVATLDSATDPHTPYNSGTWDLFLSDTLNGPTDFTGVPADVTDGTITVSTHPTADPGPGYSVPEGGSVGLDGSGSSDPEESFTWVSPVTAIEHHLALDSIVEYQWDLDGDGVFGETGGAAERGDELGAHPTFSAAGLDGEDDSPWPISLKVKDTTDLWSDPVATHVVITNVAPELLTDQPDMEIQLDDQPISLSWQFTDAGTPDTHTATIDWGDGPAVPVDSLIEPVGGTPGEIVAGHTYAAAGEYAVTMTLRDDDLGEVTDEFTIRVIGAEVVGRHVLYNDSKWDESPGNPGGDPAANAYDDNAIAPDKTPLLPGERATFQNYTSYTKGLNGIIVDIAGLAGTPTADDFLFRTGNDEDPDAWPLAPKPPNENVTVRPGEGAGGSDRVTILWPSYDAANPDPTTQAVAKQWLQVTVLPTPNTGLSEHDLFYFGNALGESGTGNFGGVALVNAVDSGAVRDNPHNPYVIPAPLDDFVDYNRDQWVNAVDFGFVRDNATNPSTALQLITVPAAGPSPGPEAAPADRGTERAVLHDAALGELDAQRRVLAGAEPCLAELSWLDSSDAPAGQDRFWRGVDPAQAAVEKLLATL